MNKPLLCPICKSDRLTELYVVNSSHVCDQIIRNPDPAIRNHCQAKIEEIWSADKASYYTCQACSFDFAYPFVGGDAGLYSLIYSSEGVYPATKWEYSVTLESIEKIIDINPESPVLFEIGAGNGSFLKLAMNKGIPAENIIATEFSEAGMKAIQSLGIRCFNKDLHSISLQEIQKKVTIICLFQVLEHLSDIHEFFARINEFTQPDARLYISVPNYYQRRFFDRHGIIYDLPPVHVGRYNEKCMGELVSAYGWKIIQSKIQPSLYGERVKKFLYARFDLWQRKLASEKVRIRILKLFLRYSIYLLLILVNLRVIAGLKRSDLGTALWFELERFK